MKHVLKVDCPDQKGLVYLVSGIILGQDMNMTANDEFVDAERGHFFMRSEIEGELDKGKLVAELKEKLPKGASVEIFNEAKKKIAVFATKEYHCLGDLLLRNEFGELEAEIQAVFSNHTYLKDLVQKFEIPFIHIPHDGLDRESHENNVLQELEAFEIDYLVLAKYMRILTPEFVKNFPNRIINIHHSFLPAFIGANPYGQAFRRGVKIIGATAHFVNHELDEGPIITQDIVRTDHSKNAKSMAQAGRDVEKVVLAKALKLVFSDRVFVNGNKTVIFD